MLIADRCCSNCASVQLTDAMVCSAFLTTAHSEITMQAFREGVELNCTILMA